MRLEWARTNSGSTQPMQPLHEEGARREGEGGEEVEGAGLEEKKGGLPTGGQEREVSFNSLMCGRGCVYAYYIEAGDFTLPFRHDSRDCCMYLHPPSRCRSKWEKNKPLVLTPCPILRTGAADP